MTAAKRKLHFNTFGEVIAEIEKLRAGYTMTSGKWNLEQMCFHLRSPIPQPLKAVPVEQHPQPNADLVKRFQHYADHDAPLPGITAPPASEPPEIPPADVIDDLIARLKSADAFNEPFVDLGPRGPVPVEVYKPFLRGHCAHHLSYLIPTQS
jgi:hypothetical protein